MITLLWIGPLKTVACYKAFVPFHLPDDARKMGPSRRLEEPVSKQVMDKSWTVMTRTEARQSCPLPSHHEYVKGDLQASHWIFLPLWIGSTCVYKLLHNCVTREGVVLCEKGRWNKKKDDSF